MYDFAWSQWERWCKARGATTLPAEPALICARHKRLSTLIERYIRPAQALEYTSSRDLGL